MNENILLIDKPTGVSSFDVIRELRKIFRSQGDEVPKMGHAGTLDPLASGLLLVGAGESTKELNNLLKLPKTYEAGVLLGKGTETGDREGKVTKEASAGHIGEREVKDALKDIIGTHRLAVPAYSAVKQDGEPLYKKVRRGETVEPPVREMTVHEAELLGFTRRGTECVAYIRFDVASGTYIRSIAEELGRKLGVPAHLESLRRTRIGDYSVDHAKRLSDFKKKERPKGWRRFFSLKR